MVYQLAKSDYKKAKPIFDVMDTHLAVNSIISGTTPASIYVDHPTDPKAAMTWTKHRFYLAGDAGNDAFNDALKRLFIEEIYPQAIAAGRGGFVLYYAPGNREDQIEVILRDGFLMKRLRQFWAIGEFKREWRTLMPARFKMRRVESPRGRQRAQEPRRSDPRDAI